MLSSQVRQVSLDIREQTAVAIATRCKAMVMRNDQKLLKNHVDSPCKLVAVIPICNYPGSLMG